MPKSFESSFGRKIIGWKKENKGDLVKAKEILKKLYDSGAEELTPYEIPKTEIDNKIIEQTEWAVDNFIKLFGVKPEPLAKERFHLVRVGGVEAATGGESKNAFFDTFSNCLTVDRSSSSDIATAVRIQHELLDLKSHQIIASLRGDASTYRSGLTIFNQENGINYLEEIDEAISAEINYRLFKTAIEKNSLYAEEMNKVDKIKPWIGRALEKKGFNKESRENYLENVYTVIGANELLEMLEGKEPDDHKIDQMWRIMKNQKKDCGLVTFERPREWSKFNELVVEILKKSNGEFKSRWAVIFEFAKAKFTGDLSSLRKTVDRILGAGSFEIKMDEFGVKTKE